MSVWTNEDGLQVRFDLSRGPQEMPGGVTSQAVHKTLVHKIADATALGDTDTAAANAHEAFIPAGAVLLRATLHVNTAFTSGGAAVLDVGFKQADGTNIDDDGVDAAVAVAALTANTAIICDGADVGTVIDASNDAYVMVTYDTAAFTAGDATLILEYLDIVE